MRRARNSPEAEAALARARARLATLELYPQPPEIDRVRVVHAPRVFRLPYMRRFDGYAMHHRILLREAPGQCSEELFTHELCHVWQMQHHPWRMPLSYLRYRYSSNPFEREARWAARATCRAPEPPSGE